ncbi:MAG: SbcC/MukB-like Walker B domain-containing protein, partial [Peptococcaceae bacterium]|nr:SbcC/MukB-like Walker B domain-containing protein [Peptococcaceae bacterium]
AEKQLARGRQQLDQLTQRLARGEKEVAALEKQRDEYSQLLLSVERQKRDIEKARRALEDQRRDYKRLKKYLQYVSECVQLADGAQRAAAEAQAKEQALAAVRSAIKQHLAASLAQELEEGVPCPVCGAVHHPKLAVAQEDTVDEALALQARDAAQRALAEAQAAMDQGTRRMNETLAEIQESLPAITDASSAQAQLEALAQAGKQTSDTLSQQEAQLKEDAAKLQSLSGASEKLAEQNAAIKKQQETHRALLTEVAQLEATVQNKQAHVDALCEKNPAPSEAQVQQLAQQIRSTGDAYDAAQAAYEQAQAQFATAQKHQLEAKSALKQASHRLAELAASLAQHQQIFDAAWREVFSDLAAYAQAKKDLAEKNTFQSRIDAYQAARTQAETTCALLAAQLDGRWESYDLAALQADCTRLQADVDAKSAALATHQSTCDNNGRLLAQIEAQYQKFQAVEGDFAIFGRLRDVMDGKNAQNLRLETYVQIYYFERMLEFANMRLSRMTHGRYAFCRKENVRDARRQAGLDLDIMDEYTGRARDVSTLSGGESFKASLSLALGLADVVRSESGGVELSTVFIDEGFGTLDEESLDDTVETLINLQNSGRLVGVISHVAELKERIQAHLVVESGPKGSHAYFEVRQ